MVRFSSVSIRTIAVSHGVRNRTARRSACKYEFLPQYIRAYAVLQHEECRHDGMQQYHILGVLFPNAIEIVHHEGVHAGASSYHNILGRTRSYSMRSVGTMEYSNTSILRVPFPYAIEIVQHERVHAGTSCTTIY